MNQNANELLLLLEWKAGRLSSSHSEAVRSRVDQDPAFNRKWQQILNVSGREFAIAAQHAGNAKNGSRGNGSSQQGSNTPAELVAAFVEQSLPQDHASKIENECFASSELLSEVISTYNDLISADDTSAGRSSSSDAGRSKLTARLESLFPAGHLKDAGPSSADEAKTDSTSDDILPPPVVVPPPVQGVTNGLEQTLSPSTATRQPTEFAIRLEKKALSRSSKLTRLALVSAAAVLMLVISGATIAYVNFRMNHADILVAQPIEDDVKPDLATKDSDAIDKAVEVATETQKNRDVPDQENDPDAMIAENDIPEEQLAEMLSMNNFPASSDVERFGEMDSVDPKTVVETQTSRDQYVNVRPQWNEVKGLLAARIPQPQGDSANPKWAGAMSERVAAEADAWTTLPGSWASATIEGLGDVIMDADSEMTIVQTGADQKEMVIRVTRGRIALKGLAPSKSVSIASGRHVWKVNNSDAESTLAVDSDAGQPRLQVKVGKIDVDGTAVAEKEQVVYDIKAKKVLANKVLGNAAPGWIDRPEQVSRLSGKLNEKLLESEDLMASLRELRTSKTSKNREIAATWSMHLSPESEISASLSSDNPQLRNETLDWLLTSDANNPTVRKAWYAVARETKNGRLTGIFMHVSKMAANKETLKFEQAMFLATMLVHDEFVWRYAADHFLSLAFGNRVEYKPDDEKAVRDRAAGRWASAIGKVYNKNISRVIIEPVKPSTRPRQK